MIDKTEVGLRDLGFPEVRVRHYGDIARIEVPITRFIDILENRERIVQLVKRAGFVYATLDLQGYRSGSMEENIRSVNFNST
jgi:uncharacterized protein